MISLFQLAQLLGAEIVPSPSEREPSKIEIRAVSNARDAKPDTLVFALDPESLSAALASPAPAVLVTRAAAAALDRGDKLLLASADPRLAFSQAAKLLRDRAEADQASAGGVHPTAVLGSGLHLDPGVSVGPYAVIGDGCHIGERSVIGAGVVLGHGVHIGRHSHIYPRVVVYAGTSLGDRVVIHAGAVLGADGFGYARNPETGEYIQFPQQGRLMVEDEVEIGANTTIDRGALEETRIAHGSKIDNLVHIGHNVSIGRNVVIAAQTGISGSSSVGDGAVLGGQVGIGDHAFVGEGVILGGQAGILPHKKLEGSGSAFWGTPAQPLARYLKQLATVARLARPARKNL